MFALAFRMLEIPLTSFCLEPTMASGLAGISVRSSGVKWKMLKPHQVSIETGELKKRLTDAYANMRLRGQSPMSVKHFEDLWDIKEKALLERQSSVVVPSGWLTKIDEQVRPSETSH
jgi:hypothetical protein